MEMLERIDRYWSMRAEEMSQARKEDLQNSQRDFWQIVLKQHLPQKKRIRALDVGTGTGFYVFLLADLGIEAVGIDYSQEMVDQANHTAAEFGYEEVSFLQMNAQELQFPDHYFDFIVSRNVTWTLPDPERAYAELCRVLAPGGVILNFDANYGRTFQAASDAEEYEEQLRISSGASERTVQNIASIKERNDIAMELYISKCIRPQWDVDVLLRHGMSKVLVDKNFEEWFWEHVEVKDSHSAGRKNDKPALCPDAPLFMVYAQKHV